MTSKEEFLIEHNKLSPVRFQVTIHTLAYFKENKPALFKNNDWSIEKIRRPFVMWLTSLSKQKKDEIHKLGLSKK